MKLSSNDVHILAAECRTSTELHVLFDRHFPGFWVQFRDLALAMIEEGRDHYSAGTILHLIRHHSRNNYADGSGVFVNDHSAVYLARRFHEAFPMHGPRLVRTARGKLRLNTGFFELRRSVHLDRLFPQTVANPPPSASEAMAQRRAA